MSNWEARFKDLNSQINLISEKYCISKKDLYVSAIWNFLRHGASIRDFLTLKLYLRSNASMKTFSSAKRYKKVEYTLNNPDNAEIVEDKKLFNTLMKEYVKRDWICTDDHSIEEIFDFIEKHEKVICKPVNAGMGEGIFVLDESTVINDEIIDTLTNESYMVEEFIAQHENINNLNSSSVNTLRVMTLRHKDGKIRPISCALKVGAKGSVVDNLSSNGVVYPVDIDRGIVIGDGMDFNGHEHKSDVLGLKIPNWESVLNTVESAAALIKDHNYLSWDVAITEYGCEVIESNVQSGYRLADFDGKGKYRYVLKNGKKAQKH